MTSSDSSNVAIVIGANGGIGSAVLSRFKQDDSLDHVYAISRNAERAKQAGDKVSWLTSDSSESSIDRVCERLKQQNVKPKYIVIAIGTLHDRNAERFPEKRLEELTQKNLNYILNTNTLMPILWVKGLSRLLNKQSQTKLVVLSARVGSIEDNYLGGWYSYRSSKAALNMLLKTAAIEFKRRFPDVKTIAFHPGTTDTELSKPFQSNVPKEKLFAPEFVAECLHALLETDSANASNISYVDWKHEAIAW